MTVRILGPLDVVGRDGTVPLGGPTQRTIFALLVLARGRAVSTDRILDTVWRDEPPASGVRNLRSVISRLRTALERSGERPIESVPAGYSLTLGRDEFDLAIAEDLSARARTEAPADAAATLADALTLWRGTPLAEFSGVPDLAAEGRRLEEFRWSLLERQVACRLQAGEHGSLAGEIERLIAEQPRREPLWGHLALALYRAGRQSDALQSFQRCRTVLGDAGLEPGPALRALEDAIATRSPQLELPAPVTRHPRSELRLRSGATPATFTLEAGQVTIGADPRNDVVLDDGAVSRAHAVMQWVGPGWVVRDVGSRNGTFVNGRTVGAEQALRSGDELRIGRAVLELQIEGEPGGRVTEVLDVPALDEAQRRVVRALCQPLIDGDLLDGPASIDAVAIDVDESLENVAEVLNQVAAILGVEPGPPWDQVARTAVAMGAVR